MQSLRDESVRASGSCQDQLSLVTGIVSLLNLWFWGLLPLAPKVSVLMLDTRDNLRVVRGGDQRFIEGDFMGRKLKVLRHLSQQSPFVQLFRFVCGDRFCFIDVWSKQPYATNSINNCKRTSVAGICLQLTVRRLISVMS